MWSFLVTVLFFIAVVGAGLWSQRKQTKRIKSERLEVKMAIDKAAEVAQRRHKATFGREDTGLHHTMSGIKTKRG